MIIATCPNNHQHKKFITVAHVTEDWIVDEYGNFIERYGARETTHGPNVGNTWVCNTCGDIAIVVKV